MRRHTVAAVATGVFVSLALTAVAAARWTEPPALTPVAITTADAASAAMLDDATIVAIFDAANTVDIETGQLAAERGHSPQVREFGAMLARDHLAVRQMGRDLAARLGVTPTPPADSSAAKAHAEAMATLRSTRGAGFDLAFLRHEAVFHKTVIDAVQTTLLPAIQNAELRALVEKVAPAFQAHMLAAQNLEKKLGGGAAGTTRY